MAAITHRDLLCPRSHVWAVLSDGWLFGIWVVGAARIRTVDDRWPATGSVIHHSVGSWPVLLNDISRVTESEPEQLLVLRAKAWPAGEAEVRIEIEDTAAGCRVTMIEDAVAGPGRLIPGPLRRVLLRRRNAEALQRLAFLAEGHARGSAPGA